MLKDFQVDLELSPKDNRVIQTGATYWSHDVNTAKIVVNLKRNSEPIILSKTVSVRMIMVFDDNDTQKKQVHKMTIDDTQNGVVSLILPKETLGFVGNVLCGVYVNYGENQSTDNGYFTFSMRRSLIDGEFPQLENGYVSEFQTMLDYMIETASEFDNVEEELNKAINQLDEKISSRNIVTQDEMKLVNKTNGLFLVGTNYIYPPVSGYGERETWYVQDDILYENMNIIKNSDKELTNESFWFELDLAVEMKKLSYKKLSFSFDVYKPTDSEPITFFSYFRSDTETLFTSEKKVLSDPGWSRVVLVMDVGDLSKAKSFRLNQGKDIPLRYNHFKLEIGDATPWDKHPAEVAGKNKILISKKSNKFLTTKNWEYYSGKLITPNVIDLQKQIDELKNAITTLGGTL